MTFARSDRLRAMPRGAGREVPQERRSLPSPKTATQGGQFWNEKAIRTLRERVPDPAKRQCAARQQARCQMVIAADPRISNADHGRYLPPSWGTLFAAFMGHPLRTHPLG